MQHKKKLGPLTKRVSACTLTVEALREDSGSIRRKRSWQVAGFVNFQELSQIDRSGRAAEAVAAQRSEFVQCS